MKLSTYLILKQAYFTETPKKRRFNKALDNLYLSQKSLNNINTAINKNKNKMEFMDDMGTLDPYDRQSLAPSRWNPKAWTPVTPAVSAASVTNVRKNINNPSYDSVATLKSMRRQIDKQVKNEVRRNRVRDKIYDRYRLHMGGDNLLLNFLDPMLPRKVTPKVYGRKAYK